MSKWLMLELLWVLSRTGAWLWGCGLVVGGMWALLNGDVLHARNNLIFLNVCLFYLWLSKGWGKYVIERPPTQQ